MTEQDTKNQVSSIGWPLLTRSRYDEDTIAFSPPEDGNSFLSFRIGPLEEKTNSLRTKSTYDSINEELGRAEEATRKYSLSKPITSKGSGLCLVEELQTYADEKRIEDLTISYQQQSSAKPILVIPNLFSSAKSTLSEESTKSSSKSEVTKESDTEVNGAVTPPVKLCANSSDQPNTDKEDTSKEHKSLGILDKVKTLFGSSTPSPNYTPEASPQLTRKEICQAPVEEASAAIEADYHHTGGVLVERKMPFNLFFMRRDHQTAGNANTMSSGATAPPPGATAPAQKKEVKYPLWGYDAVPATSEEGRKQQEAYRWREFNLMAPTST